MLARCINPNNPGYHFYGGRGITVCDAWSNDYEAFKQWAEANGYVEHGMLQLDRIDNDGAYCPDNCRFVTSRENNRNRRSNRPLTAFGETRCMSDWVDDDRCVVSYPTLHRRIDRDGWSPEQAMSTPPLSTGRHRG